MADTSIDDKSGFTGFVKVRGARQHNLKNINVDIPRDALIVFTGISGSGKSSLAFGTLYAEAQRRYLESVSPYARRLFNQMAIPEVDEIEGLPPAVALQQQRGSSSTRSSVGSVTTLSNLLRMLYSRAGAYPPGQPIIYAESFSPNTAEGACTECHGLGRILTVTEQSMVPDQSLTIRERAIAAWPTAWQGQNLREILMTLGYDVDIPWRELPKEDRDWILYTEDQPVVPIHSGLSAVEMQQAIKRKLLPSYMGTFTGVRRYVMQTFSNTQSQLMKKRVSQFMLSSVCPTCNGKRLRQESLAVKFAGLDITEISRIPLVDLVTLFRPYADNSSPGLQDSESANPEKIVVAQRIATDLCERINVMIDLGLGYLNLERSTPTLSPGELQRLRLATQIRSNLFGVVYVLDEPSAGLHPADTEALIRALKKLKAAGNSLFVVEHEIDIISHADWIVDVGPAAGELGGEILYSGRPEGLSQINKSVTRHYMFGNHPIPVKQPRPVKDWLQLEGITRNNLENLSVSFPLGILTSVTGVSGSGKTTLVSQVLVDLISEYLGQQPQKIRDDEAALLDHDDTINFSGKISSGADKISRLVCVDQKPIGRTPRSNLATYTGLFDYIRKLFAATPLSRSRHYDAGQFSFNVAKGRCPHCEGEGFVMVELLFLPSVYTPCPTCKGSRYSAETLEITYQNQNIAQVLDMTVEQACNFFQQQIQLYRALDIVRQVGLGYLRIGQSATELSGGEAQRIKLATELQRVQQGNTLYIMDEPTTGLHPADVEKLIIQLENLVDGGNTVIVVEHDMHLIAASDYIIDIGPGAGRDGGTIVAQGTPGELINSRNSRTAPYLQRYMKL